jgi:effector-binding domain-containing protein
MTTSVKKKLLSAFLLSAAFFISCSSNDSESKAVIAKDSTKIEEKTALPDEVETKYQSPPIVNIVDTVTPKRIVIFSKDSAATFDRISLKLGQIYGSILPGYIKKNNLKTEGAPMAWYKQQKAPFFFEAGIPVNKKGTKSVQGVEIREMSAGNAIVAHFYGPYELLPQGYDAIKEYIKDNKKKATGTPYEMYVADPFDKNGKPKDPYKVQTDIVFPIK